MSYDYFKTPDPEEPKEVTWGDYGRAAAGGAAGIGAGSAGLMRQMFEAGSQPEVAQIFRGLQTASRNLGEDIEGGMTEEGRGRLAAGVTTDKFWEHPVSSLALKATGMSPYLVAAAIPGALVGEGVAAMTAVGGAAGWLAAGDVVDEITRKPDKMSDADLRAQSPLYRDFRDGGDEEADARQKLNQIMVGAKPALAFLLGAGTGVFGPAGNVVRGLGRGAVREAAEAVGEAAAAKGTGFLGQHGIKAAAAEGAATELAEEGYGGYAAQKAEIEGGLRKDYDKAEIFDRALTGAVLGGVLGGATGIGGGKGKAKANEIREAQERRDREEGVPAEVETGEAGVAAPAEAAPATRRQTAASKKGIEVVEAGHPSQAEADAITDMAQPVQPKVEPVVPTPAPQPAPVPQPTAPQAAPQPPSPEVAQPQQAPVSPPAGPVAGVTPQVTPPVHDEATLTEMAKRGFLPEEVSQLTPEQTQQILKTPLTPPSPLTPSAPVQDATAPALSVTEPSAPAQVPTAPEVSPLDTNRTEPGKTVSPAENISGKITPTGRVLQDISAEGKGKQKAQAIAQRKAEKAGLATPAEKVVGVKKAAKAHKAAQDERAAHAARIFGEDTAAEPLEIPGSDKPKRAALALKLKSMVDKATSQLELRENVFASDPDIAKYYNTKGSGIKLSDEQHARYHKSVPEKVGPKADPHVRYLRELVDVQKILEKGEKLGPTSNNYRRVLNFIAAHNEKAPDLIGMSRQEAGQQISAERRGATAEQGESTQAKLEAGAAKPGAVISVTSEGAAAPGKVLEGEAKAKAAAEVLARIKEKAKAAEPAPKPAEKIVKIKEKAKPKPEPVTEKSREPEPATKPEPTEPPERVTPKVTEEVTPTEEAAADVGEIVTTATVAKMTPHERILQAKQDREEAAALATREKAAAERKAKAKPRATPEQIKAAMAALKAKKEAAEPPGLLRMSDDKPARSRVVEFTGDDDTIWDSPLHKARDLFGHDNASIGFSGNTGEVLRNLDMAHLEGEGWDVPKYIIDFTRRRLTELLGNTKIHFASANLMQDATGDAKAPFGYFHPPYQGRPGYIVVQAGLSRAQTAHVVIHEALHAVLYFRINANPSLRDSIGNLMHRLSMQTGLDEYKSKLARPALKDVHEFVSEALSNPKLQKLMMDITVTPEQTGFGMKVQTLWTRFVGEVRKMMGLPAGAHNMLSETLRLVSPELESAQSAAVKKGEYQAYGGQAPQLHRLSMDQLQDAAVGRLGDTSTNVGSKLAAAKRHVATMWDLSGRGEHSSLFGASNPLNRLFDLRAMMERAKSAILDKYNGLKAANAIAKAERAYPEAMARIKQIAFNASLHDINLDGDNAHLGKDKLMGMQAKNEIAQLKKEWNDPTLNPVRQTVRDAMKFFKDIHNAVSRETINNILAEANIHDKALAQRIHENGLTEEDEKAWAGTKLVSALDQVRALKRRQGFYIPFRRYGNYISAAEHELSVPSNATKINDNTLQFHDSKADGETSAREMAKAYLEQDSHTPQGNLLTPMQVRHVFVDRNDPSQLVEPENPNGMHAFRVSMQTQHVEMHETEAEAQNSQADLRAAGLLNDRSHKREEAFRTDVTNIQSAMGQVLRSLEKQQRYIDADSTQKAAMREMFHDLSLGLSGTTSIKNSMRQRRNVAGESRDLGRVTADYAGMTANHLAMLQYRPQFDAVFKEMREYEHAHRSDKDAIRREEVRKEFQDRIYGKAAERAEEHKGGFVTRVLQLTRLSFLAGPSFHLINMHEVLTTALPYIGGRHGFAAAFKAMTDAYSFIGGRGALVQGFKDTVKAYTDDSGFTDYVKLFKDTIGKSKIASPDKIRRMQDMIDYMDARNLYSNASIFEVAKYADPTGNIAGRALDRADLMANQVGSAIEAINRSVTGLTAYNLEYKKNGGNHEAAMHYAYSTAHNTMGDYSAWNAAPIFNKNALTRMAFQFKKFPQKTYMLLGNIVGGIAKGDPQAMKQFAGLMVTHGMVAGVLGMPTEPFKLALIAANAVGLTGFTPEDYEYAVRKMMANLAGQKGGEILSKGLYRGIGIEVSGRMGYDSLLVRGQPKSQKDADISSFLFDTMAGAPASYLKNQAQGAQAAFKGDFATAIEKMSPLRTVGDVTKAIVGATGDKKGPSGKTTQEQFTAWEAGVRALGFTPSSAAEMGALRGTQARESKRLSANRSEVVNAWIDASGAKKVDAQRAVQEFNRGRPTDEQITQKDLTNAARRREREKKVTQHGITTSKRTKAIDEQALSVFNP